MSLSRKAILVIVIILLIDQALKITVKLTMTKQDFISVFGNWFVLHFIENKGMAFGIDIPGKLGKPALTLFRLAAVVVIGFYLRKLILRKAPAGFVMCIALIFAGALGNIIDSMFYGLIFSETTYLDTARLFPPGGGYASFLHGQVVDMLYFPLFEGTYPAWFPFVGGHSFLFFRPIFNIADASISVGVISIFLFQRKYLRDLK